MSADHVVRRERLAARLSTQSVDAFLVTTPVNIRYLTGFTGSNGALLLAGDTAWLATDGRYDEQARQQTGLDRILVGRDTVPALLRTAVELGLSTIGFESEHVTVSLLEEMTASAVGVSLVARRGVVEAARGVKDVSEIAAIRAACTIADAAFAEVIAQLAPGISEREVAVHLEEAMRRLGAEQDAFPTIVAAGVHGAQPHHQPSGYRIAAGDLVTIDMGARVEGYHSDMTRTVPCGTPADWQFELYAVVEAALRAGVEAVRPGSPASSVDAAARAVIVGAGWGDRFVHGTGHGVGLQIHEAPMLFGAHSTELVEGMVITVEPGVYLPGQGGVRIEDTVLVTATGYEVLTAAPAGLQTGSTVALRGGATTRR